MGKGEDGEGVERYITGGYDFNIANDLSLDSFDSAAPSHGWRVVGEVEEDNHRSQVVVADDRIIDFLRFFFGVEPFFAFPLVAYPWDAVQIYSAEYRDLYNLASLGPVSCPASSPTSDTPNLLPLAESLVPGSPISLSSAPVLKELEHNVRYRQRQRYRVWGPRRHRTTSFTQAFG
ncbi:hypothetical protein BDP27DRAFT_778478 [Rhodocollybia butyracea]|uniref:Uncharacterized protein n=1 Tax=Rhodocollybia butyracea TaxID=206335 RepID=A0A9P5P5A9_9AGAR|nr:hypothetical protein BDP27DRAFT_778478 [Rhodocollybia butyracea]